MNRTTLYVCANAKGGIAQYARCQSSALLEAGLELELLVPRDFLEGRSNLSVPTHFFPERRHSRLRQLNRLWTLQAFWRQAKRLRELAGGGRYGQIMLASYSEYLAPLWAPALRRLKRQGLVFAAVLHDPIRDFQVGPRFWHQASVRAGFSYLRDVFVHETEGCEGLELPGDARLTAIPHGPFLYPAYSGDKSQARNALALPGDAIVCLAFGHIRDGKNLDHALHALRAQPQAWLIVAGKEQSSAQKPLRYYQEAARSLGVAERCLWRQGYIPDEEVGLYFTAADLVLLNYSASFRSASGVLNTAVQFRKPCIASGGGGNLRSSVQRYGLGAWIQADDIAALCNALAGFEPDKLAPRWEVYERENSWEENASRVIRALCTH